MIKEMFQVKWKGDEKNYPSGERRIFDVGNKGNFWFLQVSGVGWRGRRFHRQEGLNKRI